MGNGVLDWEIGVLIGEIRVLKEVGIVGGVEGE